MASPQHRVSTLGATSLVLLPLQSLASANGEFYTCDPSITAYCQFFKTAKTPVSWTVLRGHKLEGREATRRAIHNAFASTTTTAVTPQPWTNGDDLISMGTGEGTSLDEAKAGYTTSQFSSDDVEMWHYMKVFDLIAPLRNDVMYNQNGLKTDLAGDSATWNKLTKAFKDCGIKQTKETGASGTPLTVDEVKDNIINGVTSSINGYLQFLEEGAIDLVCLVAPDLDFNRCTAIRNNVGAKAGEVCNCWFDAYTDMYGADDLELPTDASAYASCTSSSTSTSTTTTSTTTTTGTTTPEPTSSSANARNVLSSLLICLLFTY